MANRGTISPAGAPAIAARVLRRFRRSSGDGPREDGDRTIALLSRVGFLISFRLYTAVAIIYFARVSHSYALGLSVFSITQITQAALDVPTGIYSDRLGRRTCLIAGSLASLVSVALYAIGHAYPVLAAGAVCDGASLALYSGNNDALLYETLAAAGRAGAYHDALGKVRSMPELAWLLAGMLGSVIAAWSFPLLMWLSVVPQVLAVALSVRVADPPMRGRKAVTVRSHLREALSLFRANRQLRRLSLASILASGIGEASFQFQPVFYVTLLPLWASGWLFSLNCLFSVIGYRLSGRVIARLTAIKLLIYQEVYSRCVAIIALAVPTPVSPLLMSLASVLFGPGEVAKAALFQREFTDRQRATMASITSTARSLLYALVALLIGVAADRLGAAKALLIAQVCLTPVLWLYVKASRATRERDTGQS